jgi:hypothetical protein
VPVSPVAVNTCGLVGVPSWVPLAAATDTVPAAPAVPPSAPPESRYCVGLSGCPGGVVGDGDGLGLVGVGLGLVVVGGPVGTTTPPVALPPLQVSAPEAAVCPAGTTSFVPSEKVTVSGAAVMFDAT